jgi:hypothetical protein
VFHQAPPPPPSRRQRPPPSCRQRRRRMSPTPTTSPSATRQSAIRCRAIEAAHRPRGGASPLYRFRTDKRDKLGQLLVSIYTKTTQVTNVTTPRPIRPVTNDRPAPADLSAHANNMAAPTTWPRPVTDAIDIARGTRQYPTHDLSPAPTTSPIGVDGVADRSPAPRQQPDTRSTAIFTSLFIPPAPSHPFSSFHLSYPSRQSGRSSL